MSGCGFDPRWQNRTYDINNTIDVKILRQRKKDRNTSGIDGQMRPEVS
jgi:hypothetical protein